MTTTLVPQLSDTRSVPSPTHEPPEDWPTGAIIALRIAALRQDAQNQGQPRYIEPHRRPFWLLDAARSEAALGSTPAFLVSLAISWALSGAIAYYAALWMNGPVR